MHDSNKSQNPKESPPANNLLKRSKQYHSATSLESQDLNALQEMQ